MDCLGTIFYESKPFLAVILLQFGFAGMTLIIQFALNQGMSPHVLVVYRHAVATLVIAPFAFVFERKIRPKMTLSIFLKILLLGLLESIVVASQDKGSLGIEISSFEHVSMSDSLHTIHHIYLPSTSIFILIGLSNITLIHLTFRPTIDQNLVYSGMKYTSATFTAAMCNVLPAFAFIFAWIFKLEKVDIRNVRSQAKIIGTVVSVGGAMVMTLMKGHLLHLSWIKSDHHHVFPSAATTHQHPIKGALMITCGCFCWAAFIILQAITLKSYPAELTLTALICLVGAIEGSIVALIMEASNTAVWSIHLDLKLLAAVYSGVICSGFAYYVQGMIIKSRGPVFVTAFMPLSMVVVAILSSLILSEILYLGRVVGGIGIVIGLYLVVWGKSKDQIEESTKVLNTEFIVLELTSSKVIPTHEST